MIILCRNSAQKNEKTSSYTFTLLICTCFLILWSAQSRNIIISNSSNSLNSMWSSGISYASSIDITVSSGQKYGNHKPTIFAKCITYYTKVTTFLIDCVASNILNLGEQRSLCFWQMPCDHGCGVLSNHSSQLYFDDEVLLLLYTVKRDILGLIRRRFLPTSNIHIYITAVYLTTTN